MAREFKFNVFDDNMCFDHRVIKAKSWKEAMMKLKEVYTDDKLDEVKSIRIAE